ncbi:MAG: hypothetical protein HYX72_02740 [Acidobacteria bacterium]|nr:hypothetical protein [Acidobacteriota bacterium]
MPKETPPKETQKEQKPDQPENKEIDPAVEFLLTNSNYLYANRISMGIGNVDVRIAFGDQFGKELKPVVGLVLTHQQAKAMTELLSRNLFKIEEHLSKQSPKTE